MANYTVYPGKFTCHICKIGVMSLRLYADTKTATWMCKEKHLSSVRFGKQKRKSDDGEK